MAYWLQDNSQAADKVLFLTNLTGQTGHTATSTIFASSLAELRRIQGRNSQAAVLYRQIVDLAVVGEILISGRHIIPG